MVYAVSTRGAFAKDYRLRDQIQGSAISVMSNIAEGFDARTDAEFIRFLGYARRSATELQSQLYTALDQNYITQEEFDRIYTQATKTKGLIGGFIRYLERRPKINIGRRT
jgi:four helix bundle protein